MTKNELIMEVVAMLDNYAPVLEASGVDVMKYRQEFDKRTVPQLKEGLHWLVERLALIVEYKKIRALLAPEIWERYKHMDTEDFREVIMINAAIAKIKKNFVGRPALFRKAKDACKCKRTKATTE